MTNKTKKKVTAITTIKRPVGRPLNFTPEQLDIAIDQYLEHCEQTLECVTEAAFCAYHKITSDWLSENKERQEFCQSIKRIKNACKIYLMHNGLKNEVNPTMAIFLLKNNHDMKDRWEGDQRTQHSGAVDLNVLADDLDKVINAKGK